MNNADEFYDRLADSYDTVTVNAWTAPEQVESITYKLVSNNSAILDIGIGTGQSVERIYRSGNYRVIEGIDCSKNMLQKCHEKFPEIILHHGDFSLFTNFSLGKYDLITCCGALEFIPDLELFIKKCKTLLNEDGHLVLTYEPIVLGHRLQSVSVSSASSERLSGIDNFLIYRRSIDEFNELIIKNKFKIIESKIFISYKKLDSDIIYILAHLSL